MEFLFWLEQTSLAMWISQSDSMFAFPGILLFHTIGLALLVGTSVVIDLRLLGFASQAPIAAMREFFPLIHAGLVINVATGLLLVVARASETLVNPAFYVKIVAIVLALVTSFGIRRTVLRGALPGKGSASLFIKGLAVTSSVLWLVAITAGRMMAYIGEAVKYGAF